MSIIYCYTNLLNNKKYVGQTKNPNQRKAAHKSCSFNKESPDYNTPFHRAIRKYGVKNFFYEILAEEDNQDKVNELEKFFIQEFNCKVPNGYNILDGGQDSSKPPLTQEQKIHLSVLEGSLSEEEVISLREAYKNHESPTKIYKEKYSKKMHYNSFLNIWCGQRYKHIMPEVFEKKYRHTKLTAEIVYQIKLDRKNLNLTYKALAEKYNISNSTIADIIHERTWKHVQI